MWFSIRNDACSSYEKEVCSVQYVGKRMTRLLFDSAGGEVDRTPTKLNVGRGYACCYCCMQLSLVCIHEL